MCFQLPNGVQYGVAVAMRWTNPRTTSNSTADSLANSSSATATICTHRTRLLHSSPITRAKCEASGDLPALTCIFHHSKSHRPWRPKIRLQSPAILGALQQNKEGRQVWIWISNKSVQTWTNLSSQISSPIMTLMLCTTKKVNSNCSSLSCVELLLNMPREMVRSLQDMLSTAQSHRTDRSSAK